MDVIHSRDYTRAATSQVGITHHEILIYYGLHVVTRLNAVAKWLRTHRSEES